MENLLEAMKQMFQNLNINPINVEASAESIYFNDSNTNASFVLSLGLVPDFSDSITEEDILKYQTIEDK